MVVSWIRDGLGNQMFRYAAGRRLAYKLNTEFKLCISWHENFIERKTRKQEKQIPMPYRLNVFNIQEKFASLDEVEYLKKMRPFEKCGEEDENHNFDPNVLDYPDNVVLFGLRQSEKYFLDIEGIIRKDFTLKEYGLNAKSLMSKIEEDRNTTVSLHFRRTEYLLPESLSFHGECSLGYYHKCLAELSKCHSNMSLYIFSDDIEWVKNNFHSDCPICYVSEYGLSEAEEMVLMSKCNHNIISNSTFSWWGAWLNPDVHKKVYAPKKWCNYPEMFRNVIPGGWIRIDNDGGL